MNQYLLFLFLAPLAGIGVLSALLVPRFMTPPPVIPKSLKLFLFNELAFLAGNSLQLIASDPQATLFLARLNHLFVVFGPVGWFLFSLSYSGSGPKKRAVYGLLFIVPLAVVLAAFTNDWHRLLWRKYHFETVLGGFQALRLDEYGPIFYLNVAQIFILLLWGSWRMVSLCLMSKRIHRRQILWMCAGVSLPLVYSFIHIFRVVPGLEKDFSSVVFAASGVCFTVAILKYRLFRDYPFTKRMLIEQAPFGLLLADSQGTIFDANPKAAEFLAFPPKKLRGLSLDAVIPGLSDELRKSPRETTGKPCTARLPNGSSACFSLDCRPVALAVQGGLAWHIVIRPGEPSKADTELSNREIEVMECLLNNLSIKETAVKLGVSENTVKFHVKNLYRKTGIHKRRHVRNISDLRSGR